MTPDRKAPAEPGQVREDYYFRWYVGPGEESFVCRRQLLAAPEPQPLGAPHAVPAWQFAAGEAGRDVGHWSGTLLDPIAHFDSPDEENER